ncbi:cation:proton antiporter [Phytomonospora sp. NPDC050363]|uniref:cation:proton antiporter n=1 Tax=Phytomonospora sp. NPDC050363 TaxID=3155642 RepID=UPI0033EF19BD
MSELAVGFILVLGGILLTPLAERMRVPAPVLTTIFGLMLGLVPSLPDLSIPPEAMLPLLLPPLLYAAARRSSWREFAANVKPILVMAVALVFVTAAVVSLVAASVHPALPIGGAIILGAIVSPPDAAAVTTIAGRLGLPRRLVTVLEGEGLFNDVTALTLYQVAVAGVVAGSFSPWRAMGEFVYSGAAAVLIGLLVGLFAKVLFDQLSDSRLTTALSLLVPYLAYIPADEAGASGVLAVLTAAFFLGGISGDPDDIEGRLVAGSFWDVTELMVTAITFGLIGLELVNVWHSVGPAAGRLIWTAVLIGGVVIAVRALWMMAAYFFSRSGRLWSGRALGWQGALVIAWSGMRGVVTIVTALALPFTTDSGEPLPGRDQILFVAMIVVVLTLLLQGLTLPWLIARIGLRVDAEREAAATRKVHEVAREAAFQRLDELLGEDGLPTDAAERMRARYELMFTDTEDLPEPGQRNERERMLAFRDKLRETEREMMSAARAALLAARTRPGYDPAIIDQVMSTLDVRSAGLGG